MDSNKYQKGKIYKIVPKYQNEDMCYIGSTCMTLKKRMISHISNFKTKQNRTNKTNTSYKMLERYGIENCDILLIEDFPCNSKIELYLREAYHISQNPHCVNVMTPILTEEERRQKNIERTKDYRLKNSEIVKEKDKKRYHRQRTEEGKKYHQDFNKKWFEKNKSKYQNNLSCDCGGKYSFYYFKKHQSTKCHNQWEKEQYLHFLSLFNFL